MPKSQTHRRLMHPTEKDCPKGTHRVYWWERHGEERVKEKAPFCDKVEARLLSMRQMVIEARRLSELSSGMRTNRAKITLSNLDLNVRDLEKIVMGLPDDTDLNEVEVGSKTFAETLMRAYSDIEALLKAARKLKDQK